MCYLFSLSCYVYSFGWLILHRFSLFPMVGMYQNMEHVKIFHGFVLMFLSLYIFLFCVMSSFFTPFFPVICWNCLSLSNLHCSWYFFVLSFIYSYHFLSLCLLTYSHITLLRSSVSTLIVFSLWENIFMFYLIFYFKSIHCNPVENNEFSEL